MTNKQKMKMTITLHKIVNIPALLLGAAWMYIQSLAEEDGDASTPLRP